MRERETKRIQTESLRKKKNVVHRLFKNYHLLSIIYSNSI